MPNGQERERGVGASRPSADGGSDWPDAVVLEGPLNFSIVEGVRGTSPLLELFRRGS
jgi:hypothetical protein